MADIVMDTDQFETLVNFAMKGTEGNSQELANLLKSIEKANGSNYFRMLVQWQDSDYPLPAGAAFPRNWPPELRALITRVNQPVSKQDVLDMLEAKGSKPSNILVTDDVDGIVGWSTLTRRFG